MPAQLEEWVGEGVTVAEIERELGALRSASAAEDGGALLRMSTMTHLAWAPEEWVERAMSVLHGMGERHPSRTIVLIPEPDAGVDRLDAELSLECFPLSSGPQNVCAEVVVLRLKGRRALAPASIVEPLLIADLPVFCRWRGEPPWGTGPFEQMVDLVDRLVLNSSEWDDLPYAYAKLPPLFERAAVSDIPWSRTLGWRRALAELWPGIAEARRLRVEGPQADALLLRAWLDARLGTELELEHVGAEEVESVAVNGEEVAPPRSERPTPSEQLSTELDQYGRDLTYEQAIRTV
jgi:glucose-6-phosphate dehydrogenase assembly protein OpcA